MSSQIIPVEPFDYVVFGGTGDLAERKLLPALFHRQLAGPGSGQAVALEVRGGRHQILSLRVEDPPDRETPRIPGQFVRIDVSVDSGLCEWLGLAGLECVISVTQMALGTPPQPRGDVRQFALISQAMG